MHKILTPLREGMYLLDTKTNAILWGWLTYGES